MTSLKMKNWKSSRRVEGKGGLASLLHIVRPWRACLSTNVRMHDLDHAPLILLVETKPGESPAEVLRFMEQYFDRRIDDVQFGPLYRIG